MNQKEEKQKIVKQNLKMIKKKTKKEIPKCYIFILKVSQLFVCMSDFSIICILKKRLTSTLESSE